MNYGCCSPYTPNCYTYTLNLLVVHPEVCNFISISLTFSAITLAIKKFQNFTVYETAYALFITSKILKIERKLNIIIDVETETFFDVRKFDVLNLNFSYGH